MVMRPTQAMLVVARRRREPHRAVTVRRNASRRRRRLRRRRSLNDFTTWTPDTEALMDWDSSAFPSDAVINICTVRCYMAVAMIMLYQTELRERHKPFQKKVSREQEHRSFG